MDGPEGGVGVLCKRVRSIMHNKKAAMLILGIVILGGSLVYKSSQPIFAQADSTAVNGKTKVVKLVDGRTLTGVVREIKDGIELETKFGVVRFKRDQIESMTDVAPKADEYAARKAKIDESSSKDFYELARWVWDNYRNDTDMLQKAREDIEESLNIDPANERAKLLLRQVDAVLNGSSQPITTGHLIKPTGKNTAGNGTVADVDKYLISQEDIYWIRLMELAAKDSVSVTFMNNAVNRYIELMKGKTVDGWDRIGNDRRFRAASPTEKVQEILRNQFDNTDLLKDVQITRDPSFMIEFRSKVWPQVKQYCASPQCHGGPQPKGGFKFFVMPNNVKADYTNFVILSCFRNSEGRKLIERDDVDTSLLLQYGLNPKVARFVHPKVNNQDITFMYPNINAKTYKTASRWIQSLTRPEPNYHLQYKVPFGMKIDVSGRPYIPSEDAGSSGK